MSLTRWFAVLAVSTAFAAAATSASAQGRRDGGGAGERTLFTWSGTVDREVTFVMRDDNLSVRGEQGIRTSGREAARALSSIPRVDGRVIVRVHDGRGDVRVVQQPDARNNYATLVRVLDPRSGADRYRLTVSWEPAWRDDGRRDDRRDDDRGDRGRSRDGDWDFGDILRGGGAGNSRLNSGVHWTGVVDDVVDLEIRGKRVRVIERSGSNTYGIRTEFFGGSLSRNDNRIQLVRADGRGRVEVLQHPDRRNKNTAIVRIVDRKAGAARYDLDVRW